MEGIVMKPLKRLTAAAAAVNRPNIDTDLIIPKQFLIKIERDGYGRHLFHNIRFLEDGRENPDFVLNKPGYREAKILAAQENFGCGSSREHAAWALEDFGIRVVLAPSFGDIFRNNAFNCGLAPIELDQRTIDDLIAKLDKSPGTELTVDLEEKLISGPDGLHIPFEMEEHRRRRLVGGLDMIGLTLQKEEAIKAYEKSHAEIWLAGLPSPN
jgi:3-isopropylmalate/(R)-2-methylmalate dehydratase small subunit